ncbi:hypothetical protein DL96DRAFT_1812034 [Flagelloscypha sp. PMI_526]|nr:hypothetical protein DL96DRAFT_1812034 [Flagelloscypha sp. PMI_526]
MASRRRRSAAKPHKGKKSATMDDDDLDFAMSQSPSSDDHIDKLALAETIFSTKEKKSKEKQAKFLSGAKKHLHRENQKIAQLIVDKSQAADELYARFQMDYAENEDKIRKLWIEFEAAESRMLEIHNRRIEIAGKTEQHIEKNLDAALASQKESINNFSAMKNALYPAGAEKKYTHMEE